MIFLKTNFNLTSLDCKAVNKYDPIPSTNRESPQVKPLALHSKNYLVTTCMLLINSQKMQPLFAVAKFFSADVLFPVISFNMN